MIVFLCIPVEKLKRIYFLEKYIKYSKYYLYKIISL